MFQKVQTAQYACYSKTVKKKKKKEKTVPFPQGATDLSLLHNVQTSLEAHPASYPVDNGGSFSWVKAAGALG